MSGTIIIKALTLAQPWATLVAIGAKRTETRSWSVRYRGPLAIHAAKSFPLLDRLLLSLAPFRNPLAAAGYKNDWDLPTGRIVAICSLQGCFKFLPGYRPEVDEAPFGDFTPGRIGWHLGGVLKLIDPIIPPPGFHRGLWNWEVPDELASRLCLRSPDPEDTEEDQGLFRRVGEKGEP